MLEFCLYFITFQLTVFFFIWYLNWLFYSLWHRELWYCHFDAYSLSVRYFSQQNQIIALDCLVQIQVIDTTIVCKMFNHVNNIYTSFKKLT